MDGYMFGTTTTTCYYNYNYDHSAFGFANIVVWSCSPYHCSICSEGGGVSC